MATALPFTVELVDLSASTAADHRFAAGHLDDLADLPCYCACDHSLGHRNLADCYLTSAGMWNAHASGCGVCGVETAVAGQLFSKGAAVAEVRAQIIDQYRTPPALFTPGAPS